MKCERVRKRAFSNCTNSDAPECVQPNKVHIQAGPKTCFFKLHEFGRARMCAAEQSTHSGGSENVNFQIARIRTRPNVCSRAKYTFRRARKRKFSNCTNSDAPECKHVKLGLDVQSIKKGGNA